ncbi:MAG: hypothetical protein SWQ30_12730 [Thermodesulfobacteriota bacterium]|nr:hypothetical protein [Thermodesulfobacteriota bacterium]
MMYRKANLVPTVLLAAILGVLAFQAFTLDEHLHERTRSTREQHQLLERQAFHELLAGLRSADASSYVTTVKGLTYFPATDGYVEDTLLELADSDQYLVAKVAIQALVGRGTDKNRRIVESFWKLCKAAAEKDYANDKDLARIFDGIECHVEWALVDYMQGLIEAEEADGEEDAIEDLTQEYRAPDEEVQPDAVTALREYLDAEADLHTAGSIYGPQLINAANQFVDLQGWESEFFSPEQAELYMRSFDIFEVLTYFGILLRDTTAPSGVYSHYDPTSINLHYVLFRLISQNHIPDFYSGVERAMYMAVTSGDIEFYRNLWDSLYEGDPLLQGGDISTILYSTNSRGIKYGKREAHIIYYPSGQAQPFPESMMCSLIRKQLGIKTKLKSVEDLSQELAVAIDDSSWLSDEHTSFLNTTLYVTFSVRALEALNDLVSNSDHDWFDVTDRMHVVSFLPIEWKGRYDPNNLALKPETITWYDPLDPFESEKDALTIVEAELLEFALKRTKE